MGLKHIADVHKTAYALIGLAWIFIVLKKHRGIREIGNGQSPKNSCGSNTNKLVKTLKKLILLT
jgi:hypothetical protein